MDIEQKKIEVKEDIARGPGNVIFARIAICDEVIDVSKIDYFLIPSLDKKYQRETLDILNMLDLTDWWFYEDSQIEYGGLAEWVVLGKRFPFGNGREDPGHPSEESHGTFTDAVIYKLLKEMRV